MSPTATHDLTEIEIPTPMPGLKDYPEPTVAQKVHDVLMAFGHVRATIIDVIGDPASQARILKQLEAVEASATRAATMKKELNRDGKGNPIR